ncbi:MAG: GNAT family N-acetyltransferase [Bacteroidia bacterium]
MAFSFYWMKLQFIHCDNEKINTIAQLANEIWNEYYPPIIGQQQVNYMLSKLYNTDAIQEQMSNGQIFYLISVNDNNIGFFSYSLKNDGSGFLHKFYLLKSYRGKNYASITLNFLELVFKNMNIKEYRLTVNRQNAQAINFYFKSGFKIEQVADFDIGNGFFMNDFVMIKKIN